MKKIAETLASSTQVGGAWLVWQGVREQRGIAWVGAGIVALGQALDGFRPARYDLTGALICLVGVGVIMYAPRPV